jgi:hypothetical protein
MQLLEKYKEKSTFRAKIIHREVSSGGQENYMIHLEARSNNAMQNCPLVFLHK